MSENRLIFLKDAFPELELKFTDDFSGAEIVNPNYDENIVVRDDEVEFTVFFSFLHCHFEDEEDVIEWIRQIIFGITLAIEFFHHEQAVFGGEIDVEVFKSLTYEKLERSQGYYGIIELSDVADSFKIRGWDRKNNFDYTINCDANGNVRINPTFIGTI